MCRRGSTEERRTARVVCARSPAAAAASKTSARTAPTPFALLFRFAHPTDYGSIEVPNLMRAGTSTWGLESSRDVEELA